jgi:hypothetical protein
MHCALPRSSFGRHLGVDHVKTIWNGNLFPDVEDDTTTMIWRLSSTPKTLMSRDPHFSQVLEPPMGIGHEVQTGLIRIDYEQREDVIKLD